MADAVQIQFEASAYLQRLIGRELVPDEHAALVELVKNAYDSGAKVVEITIQPETKREPGFIDVRDDGTGMSRAVIQKHFMWAGNSERPDQVSTASRVPTGEKGIGRFASDRLGSVLCVRTREAGVAKALQVDIDWKQFEDRKKRFSDVKAKIQATDAPELGKHGTSLHMTRLRVQWDAARIQELRSHLQSLLDPFDPPADFEIVVTVPNSDKLSGAIAQPAPEDADIEVGFKVLKSGIRRSVAGKSAKIKSGRDADVVTSKADTSKLTGLTGRLLYFVKRPPKKATAGVAAGVRLYRDGFRVEPFGSPTADWLGISEKRAKRAGHAHIVPTRLFGFIEIHREQNKELVDTTSRQALLSGEAASALVSFLREQVDFLEELIRTREAEPRWAENRKKRAAEFEQARLQVLGVMSFGLAHELRQPLQAIRSEADNIARRLKQLKISDHHIDAANTSIDQGIERIDQTIKLVADISRGDTEKVSTFDLAEIVREEAGFFESRCSAEGIDLKVLADDEQAAHVNRFAVTTVIVNIIKNAIDALAGRSNGSKPRVTVRVRKSRNKHLIEIQDNGDGISPELQPNIFKKFASKKTGGMGVGLYFCRTIVQAWDGDITFKSKRGETVFTVTLPDREGNDGQADPGSR